MEDLMPSSHICHSGQVQCDPACALQGESRIKYLLKYDKTNADSGLRCSLVAIAKVKGLPPVPHQYHADHLG